MKSYIKKDYHIPYPEIEGDLSDLRYPCLAQPKADGELNFAICDGKVVLVNKPKYGRHREDFFAIKELASLGLEDIILVGELHTGKDFYNFERNKTSDTLKFSIFDGWQFKKDGKFYTPKKDEELRDRLLMLAYLGVVFENFKFVEIMKGKIAKNRTELLKIKEDFIKQGYEGVVAKNLSSKSTSTFILPPIIQA